MIDDETLRRMEAENIACGVRHFDLLLEDDDESTIDAAADRLLEKNHE